MPKHHSIQPITVGESQESINQQSCHDSKNEGMPPKEIRMRIHLSGISIAKLAKGIRRSPSFIHQVISRERRSDPVESAIARLLAWQGYTRGDIWGARRASEPSESSAEMMISTEGELS